MRTCAPPLAKPTAPPLPWPLIVQPRGGSISDKVTRPENFAPMGPILRATTAFISVSDVFFERFAARNRGLQNDRIVERGENPLWRQGDNLFAGKFHRAYFNANGLSRGLPPQRGRIGVGEKTFRRSQSGGCGGEAARGF